MKSRICSYWDYDGQATLFPANFDRFDYLPSSSYCTFLISCHHGVQDVLFGVGGLVGWARFCVFHSWVTNLILILSAFSFSLSFSILGLFTGRQVSCTCSCLVRRKVWVALWDIRFLILMFIQSFFFRGSVTWTARKSDRRGLLFWMGEEIGPSFLVYGVAYISVFGSTVDSMAYIRIYPPSMSSCHSHSREI